MSDAGNPTRPKVLKALSALWSDRHFVMAAGVLAAVTIGWNWAVAQLKWATRKEPVPWPQHVRVDNGCRLTSFPDRLGPFVLVTGDGEFTGASDGRPDGEIILGDEDLESLRINTALDQRRLGERSSNWYLARLYRDTRVTSPQEPFRYWRLEVYYYTGGLDKVPHVPERCLVAGGATLLPSASGKVPMPAPSVPSPWDNVSFNRTAYEFSDRLGLDVKRYVQYYLFSLNGMPENSWEMVRLELTKPWVRYCYFAKIQLAPLGEVTDIAQADKAAGEFVNALMPAALSMLPMPSEIDSLGEAAGSDGKAPH